MYAQKNIQIWHNPQCSKSRQTLALLEQRNLPVTIIEYLKTPPSLIMLKNVLQLLQWEPRQLIRSNETLYKELQLNNLKLSRQALIETMHRHPRLIERPIVIVDRQKAALGRPPENILTIL